MTKAKIVQTTGRQQFDTFEPDQIETLEKACQIVDPRLYVAKLDYDKGTISIGFHHEYFDEDDFISVNVASDSVPSAFYDVCTRVYSSCI